MAATPVEATHYAHQFRSRRTNAAIRGLVGQMGVANPLWARAPSPRGIDKARHRCVGADGLAPSATTPSSAVTDLANLSDESHGVSRVDGLVHCADPHRPRAVCARTAISRAAPNRPSPDHGASHGRVDGPAESLKRFPRTRPRPGSCEIATQSMGDLFRRRVATMGIREVISAPSSPWQNPYVERLIGSIRRECLDHVIIFNHTHLRCTLARYVSSYNGSRTHLSLAKDAPTSRRVRAVTDGHVIAFPEVGGLHHRYERRAA